MTSDSAVPLLIGSMAALFVGPVLYRSSRSLDQARSFLDGFVFVAISGLLGLHILPEILAEGGMTSLGLLAVGFLGPTIMERLSRYSRAAHSLTLYLALAGLCLHAVVDGAALLGTTGGGSGFLAIAVILHRLPIGLGIWWLMRPTYSISMRWAVLSVVCAATILGFSGGSFLVSEFSGGMLRWFQAFVAGSLLHVVLHRPGEKPCTPLEPRWAEGAGSLLGILLLIGLTGFEVMSPHLKSFSSAGETFWALALKSAPALTIGYILAGLASTFLPLSSIHWLKRGSSVSQSAKGMITGLPVPICSCGVVPLYRTLTLRGAPLPAATAFLVATPELGLDAVLLSFPLLGMQMTIARVVAAVLVALFVGWMMGVLASPNQFPERKVEQEKLHTQNTKHKLREGFRIGLIEVIDHTAPWVLFGLILAAVTEPFLTGGWMESIPGPLGVLVFALLGLPAYVCASGATPLVAILLFNGLSPGAALAFLLTGPATNVTTFGVLSSLHGKKVAGLFSVLMIGSAVTIGCFVNLFTPAAGIELPSLGHHSSSIEFLCLIFLSILILFSVLRRGARQFAGEISGSAFEDSKSCCE